MDSRFVQIQKNYQGCPSGKTIVVRTHSIGQACEAWLEKGESYVLPLNKEERPFIQGPVSYLRFACRGRFETGL